MVNVPLVCPEAPAMAFAPVSLVQGEITIAHPEVVSKSYPSYWEHLRQAGFIITENESAC
jgi:3-phosphoshikimate 1-carboxyvinyltransferase